MLTCHILPHDNRHALSVPPLFHEVNEVSVTTSGVCVCVCVLLPATTAVSIAEAEASWSCLVCVRASTYTRSQPVAGIPMRGDCGRHRLPVVQRRSREHQRPPPPGSGSKSSRRGALVCGTSAGYCVTLLDGMGAYSSA